MRSRIEEFGHHHPVLGKVIALVFFLSMLAVPWLAGGVRFKLCYTSWDTAERKHDESWREYSSRTEAETVRAIDDMPVEKHCRIDLRDHLLFNITYVDEHDV